MKVTISEIASLVGLVFGVAGFVLGIMNFLRDRSRVIVDLQWDLTVTEGAGYDQNRLWGLIRVSNAGRRPTYVSHVALRLPKGYDHSYLIIAEGITGKRLSEGDPPESYLVKQDGMEEYARDWREVVAQVSDATGQVWNSNKLKKNQVPTWAKLTKRV